MLILLCFIEAARTSLLNKVRVFKHCLTFIKAVHDAEIND